MNNNVHRYVYFYNVHNISDITWNADMVCVYAPNIVGISYK